LLQVKIQGGICGTVISRFEDVIIYLPEAVYLELKGAWKDIYFLDGVILAPQIHRVESQANAVRIQERIVHGRALHGVLDKDVVKINGKVGKGAPECQVHFGNGYFRFQVIIDLVNHQLDNVVFENVQP